MEIITEPTKILLKEIEPGIWAVTDDEGCLTGQQIEVRVRVLEMPSKRLTLKSIGGGMYQLEDEEYLDQLETS